jgi:hypothetical protein
MFDPKKPVVTAAGRPARIICTDRKYLYDGRNLSVLALVVGADGQEVVHAFDATGKGHSDQALVNIKVKKWRWVVYQGELTKITGGAYSSVEEVAKACMIPREKVVGRVMETEIEE